MKMKMLVKEVEKNIANKKSKSAGKSGDLNQLFKSAEGKDKPSDKMVAPSNDTGKNLLRLLSQPDQSNNEGRGDTPPTQQSEKTSASVKDFFAMASSNDIQSTSPQVGSTGQSAFTSVPLLSAPSHTHTVQITALPISQGLAMGAVPVAGYPMYPAAQHMLPPGQPPAPVVHHPSPSTNMNPMVQRLMSNPGIHSVESIEAEQRRSTSPNNGVSSSPPDQMNPNTKKLNDLESQLKQKLQIGSNKTFAPVKSPSQAPEVNGTKTQLSRRPPILMTASSTQPTLLSPQVFSSSGMPRSSSTQPTLLSPQVFSNSG